MSTRLSTKKLILAVVAVFFLATLTTLVFFPRGLEGIGFIVSGKVNEMIFDLKGNTGIVWLALGSKGPGYSNLRVLAHEDDKSNYHGVFISFQVTVDTTKTPLLCQGQVHFFPGDPAYINLDWQDERCKKQYQIVGLAHYTLNNDGLHAVLPEEDMYLASSLLMAWIDRGKINLQRIQNTRMRDLVDSRMYPDPMSSEIKLDGTRWILWSLNGHKLQDNTIITLKFDAKNVDGRGRCNSYKANYSMEPNYGFKVDKGGWTEMACLKPKGAAEQEREYLSAFSNVTNYYSMEENTLLLANEKAGVVLLYHLLPKFDVHPEDLIGKTWQLVSSNGLQTVKAHTFTLRFDEIKLELSGTTSCRPYEGMYFVEDDILRVLFMNMGTTITCSNDDSVAEANYITLLTTTWQYNIVDSQLQLYTQYGSQMVFELVSQNTYP